MKNRSVDVERTFLFSMTVTVCAAALVLAVAEGSWFPAALTPLVATASYLVIDRGRRFRLPVAAANVLGVMAFLVMAWEFYGNTVLGKLLSGAHLLVYISWVVLLLQKGIRQFWWLAALSILQLAVASVLTNEPSFGLSLMGMLLLMLWTLSVFTLYRGRIRVAMSRDDIEDSLNPIHTGGGEDSLNPARARQDVLSIRNGLQVDSEEPWIGWRFRAIVGFAFVASLMVAIITFFVFPRIWTGGSPLAGIAESARRALMAQTGFTENVQLGEIGEIMQTEGRVLQFEATRRDGGAVMSPEDFANALRMDELLFRGNALGHYDKGRWMTGASQGRSVGDLDTEARFVRDPRASDLRLRIIQDPPIQKFAFVPVPVQNVVTKSRTGSIRQARLSSSLLFVGFKRDEQLEPTEFTAWYRSAPVAQSTHSPNPMATPADVVGEVLGYFRNPTRYEQFQRDYAYDWCVTRNLNSALPQLVQTAKDVSDAKNNDVSDRQRVQRIYAWLTSPSRFEYSLNATIQDPGIDPVEDFLINRRSGHCEYFASACALMLQAVGIPARIVNGYKGYEKNSVSGKLEVKQKHAHAWVEAFVDGRWETLDPTPAAREAAVTRSSNLAWWQDLQLAFSDGWLDLVERMSPQRQEAIVRPLLAAARKKLEEIRRQGVFGLLKEFWTEVVLHPSKWFSPWTGVVTFVLLLIVGLIIRQNPSSWLMTRLQSLLARLQPGSSQTRSVVRFYETFCDVCRRHGLLLPAHQTAQENAHMANRHFAATLITAEDRALPVRIATAFNQVRFGQVVLPPQVMTSLRNDVGRLSDLLKNADRTDH